MIFAIVSVMIGLASPPERAGLFAVKTLCDIPAGRCTGCGCKGGPGYRSNATGKCVGFKQLTKECGDPPTQNCVFENAPGTGANRECALSR